MQTKEDASELLYYSFSFFFVFGGWGRAGVFHVYHSSLAALSVNIVCLLFREFKEDSSTKEICFPATLTQKEKDCIKQAAQEMGLKVEAREVH